MDHKHGSDPNQVFMFCLESAIANDSFVRVVDAFADAIDVKSLKRQHGLTFTLVCAKENIPGEVGLMFIEYNLSRCISVLGAEKLIKALIKFCLAGVLSKIRPILNAFNELYFRITKTTSDLINNFNIGKVSKFHLKYLYLFVN